MISPQIHERSYSRTFLKEAILDLEALEKVFILFKFLSKERRSCPRPFICREDLEEDAFFRWCLLQILRSLLTQKTFSSLKLEHWDAVHLCKKSHMIRWSLEKSNVSASLEKLQTVNKMGKMWLIHSFCCKFLSDWKLTLANVNCQLAVSDVCYEDYEGASAR